MENYVEFHYQFIENTIWLNTGKKMLSLNENSIVKKVYNALKVDDLNNKTYRNKNWVTRVKTVLHEYGYQCVRKQFRLRWTFCLT